jgi:ketosteroid isomerase-like protein
MHHSEDVRDAFVRFLADVSSGGDTWADRLASTEDGASLIGTDDTEWHQGSAMRAAWTGLAHAFRTTGMRIVASDPYAYAEGTIGWVIDRPTFETAGGRVQTRMTAIFRREGDHWQIVHVHNSVSVPNAQGEGFAAFGSR